MARLLVRDLMTTRPYTLASDADLATLYDLMSTRNVRHVLIVDGEGSLLGIVSHRDLMRSALFTDVELPLSEQRNFLRSIKVSEVMTRDPETVDPEDDLAAAGVTMVENKFGCLPVLEGDKLVGILTESDFVRYVVASQEARAVGRRRTSATAR